MQKRGKQIGVIVYGGGLNIRQWADDAKRAGYLVVYGWTCVELYERA